MVKMGGRSLTEIFTARLVRDDLGQLAPHEIESAHDARERIADFVHQDDFYRYDHRIIFQHSLDAVTPVGERDGGGVAVQVLMLFRHAAELLDIHRPGFAPAPRRDARGTQKV